MSLFHWQIQAEAQRIEEISPELLNMHDSDGDTYVCVKNTMIKIRMALP